MIRTIRWRAFQITQRQVGSTLSIGRQAGLNSSPTDIRRSMRIIIVADNASSLFGGEAFIPLNYFRILLARNVDVRLVVHARNKTELIKQFPDDQERLYFVEDTWLHKHLFHFGQYLPRRLAEATTGLVIHLTTQSSQRRIVRALVRTFGIDVVHQPVPVSPKTPLFMNDAAAT